MNESVASYEFWTHRPEELVIPWILLCMVLCVARLWKNLEFLSPLTNQKLFARYLHIWFSFINNPLMSFVSSLTQELLADCNVACSAFTKSFFFSTSSLRTLLKFLPLHWVNSVPHLAIFFITWTLGSQGNEALQTASTVHPHPLFESHISSNRNGFEIRGGSRPSGTIQIGTWSEVVLWRWKTHVLANHWSQSLVQKALASLSHMD